MARKIHITSSDRERLLKLIKEEREFGTAKQKQNLNDLERELERANIVKPQKVPPEVITMNSKVMLKDLDTGEKMIYTLVYPEKADLLENKISVLAPVGTAILGFSKGDVIEWNIPAGSVRLSIEEILYQPESAGESESL